jgi:hypothetical protein
MLKKTSPIFFLIIFAAIVVHEPKAISEPAASPWDHAKENLTRIAYPSGKMKWKPYFEAQDNLNAFSQGSICGPVQTIDRRHAILNDHQVPADMNEIKTILPCPRYMNASGTTTHPGYLTEQWLGAYEYGRLKFSMPAATGMDGHNTPNGLFRIDARDKNHTSSLYKTEDQQEQYPMDNAFRFHVGKDNISTDTCEDLPGRPASTVASAYMRSDAEQMYDSDNLFWDAGKPYDWAVEKRLEDDTGDLNYSKTDPSWK